MLSQGKKSNHKGISFNLMHSVIISSKRIESQLVSLSEYGMLTYISTLILTPLLGLIIYRQAYDFFPLTIKS